MAGLQGTAEWWKGYIPNLPDIFTWRNLPELPSTTRINLEEPVRVASTTRINLEEPVRVASTTRINSFLRQSVCPSVCKGLSGRAKRGIE